MVNKGQIYLDWLHLKFLPELKYFYWGNEIYHEQFTFGQILALESYHIYIDQDTDNTDNKQ